MNKKIKEITEFFPSSNLNNISFYFLCPTIKEEQKREISELIVKNKGVRNINYLNIALNRDALLHYHLKQ